jgi:hypothetical protein
VRRGHTAVFDMALRGSLMQLSKTLGKGTSEGTVVRLLLGELAGGLHLVNERVDVDGLLAWGLWTWCLHLQQAR